MVGTPGSRSTTAYLTLAWKLSWCISGGRYNSLDTGNLNADYELAVGAPFDPWYEHETFAPGERRRLTEKRGRVYIYGKALDEFTELSQLLQDDLVKKPEQLEAFYGYALAINSHFY